MKIGKKTVMGISFVVGTIMFATTAFAEVSTKSGYEQAKDALKYSADTFSSKLQSYTINTSIIVKDNGNIICENDKVNKYDFSNHAEENTGTLIESNKPKTENYYYADKNTIIDYDSKKDAYNVINYNKPNNFTMVSNPFKEKQEGDLEKIADAMIGNLKDSVVVNTKTDGTKELSGTISESQIPAIANAILSYETKIKFNTRLSNSNDSIFPKDISDVYVNQVNGDMILNKDGLIQSGSGSAEITCKDDEGNVQDLTFEILAKVVDINTTKVNKPDLTGKKVSASSNQIDNNKLSDPQSYVGTYKNDIVIKKDGKFQKIGERFVDLTSVDDKKVTGRYHAEYLKGYESYDSDIKDLNFSGNIKDINNVNLEIIDSKGNKIKGDMFISTNSASIDFGFNNGQNQEESNSSQYDRVFN